MTSRTAVMTANGPDQTDAGTDTTEPARPQLDSEAEKYKSHPPSANSLSSTVDDRAPTPFGQRTEGIATAVQGIDDIAQGVKSVVDTALRWTEQKADKLRDETDSTGPYTSPATCTPSDLDPIASGVLPAMSANNRESMKGGSQDVKAGGKARE